MVGVTSSEGFLVLLLLLFKVCVSDWLLMHESLGDCLAGPNLRFKLPSTDPMARGLRMASAGARAYNGGLGAEPPAGSRGRAPGQGVRGRSPPEAESLFSFQCPMKAAKLTPLTNWQNDFCHVSTTLNRVPNTSLLRSEE